MDLSKDTPKQRLVMVVVLLVSIALQTHLMVAGYINGVFSDDGQYYYVFIPSLLEDGDIDFTNEYAIGDLPDSTPIDPYFMNRTITPTGLPITIYPPGSALMRMPFALLGHTISAQFHRGDPTWRGYFSHEVLLCSNWAAIFYGHLTVLLLYSILRRYVSWGAAFGLSMSLVWLTVTLRYMTAVAGMAHVPDMFVMTLLLWLCWRWSRGWRMRWLVPIGLVAGFALSVRPQNILSLILLAPIYAAAWIILARPSILKVVQSAVILGVTALVTALPLIYYNMTLFGKLNVVPQDYLPEHNQHFMNWFTPHMVEGLFSSRGGLFPYNPFLILAGVSLVITLVFFRRLSPRLVWLLIVPSLAMFIIQLYVNTTVPDWWGGGYAPGGRRLLPVFPLFLFGMAGAWLVIRRWRSVRRVVVPVTVVVAVFSLWFNLQLPFLIWDVWGPTRAGKMERDPVRDLAVHLAGQIREFTSYRRPCTDQDTPILIDPEEMVTRGFTQFDAMSDGSFQGIGGGTLGLTFPVQPNRDYHVGFHVETPYGMTNRIELSVLDKQTGIELANRHYDNMVNDYIGITAHSDIPVRAVNIEPGWVVRVTIIERFHDMPFTIRDLQACAVSGGENPNEGA